MMLFHADLLNGKINALILGVRHPRLRHLPPAPTPDPSTSATHKAERDTRLARVELGWGVRTLGIDYCRVEDLGVQMEKKIEKKTVRKQKQHCNKKESC